jgi:hypothetical protein
MLNNGGGNWYGLFTQGVPVLTNSGELSDFLIWMDWPGFRTGAPNNSNAVVEGSVNQLSYKLDLMSLPANSMTGNTWFVIAVPHSLINGGTQIYSQIGINYNGSTSLLATNTNSALRSVDVTYTGSNWANDTYRIFSAASGLGFNAGAGTNVNGDIYYFGDGTLISS